MTGYMPPAERDDWQTPAYIFDPLHHEFNFTVDAAASESNAMLPRYWTVEDDALAQDWRRERIWCNPPYGNAAIPFIKKAQEAATAGLLLPARTDTRIWHESIFPHEGAHQV